jgi:hypothetical protein
LNGADQRGANLLDANDFFSGYASARKKYPSERSIDIAVIHNDLCFVKGFHIMGAVAFLDARLLRILGAGT